MIRFFQDPNNHDLYFPSAQQQAPEGTIVELRLGFRRQFVSQEGERILNERLIVAPFATLGHFHLFFRYANRWWTGV